MLNERNSSLTAPSSDVIAVGECQYLCERILE